MPTVKVQNIRKSLEKVLDKKRYDHTLSVAYTAAALAMRYDEDVKSAELAGLLHDCAKCIDNNKKLALCDKYNIQVNEVEKSNPYLLHAKLGSFLAMQKYDIRDTNIINAILNHTTGRPNMSLLEKIIYVADYIEPNRAQAPNLKEIRRLAFIDLNQALLCILEDTLSYLNAIDSPIDPMTQKTYDYYKELSEEKKIYEHCQGND